MMLRSEVVRWLLCGLLNAGVVLTPAVAHPRESEPDFELVIPDVVVVEPHKSADFYVAVVSRRPGYSHVGLSMDASGIAGLGRFTEAHGECIARPDSIWCDTLIVTPEMSVPAHHTIGSFRIDGSPNPPAMGKTVFAVMTGVVSEVRVSQRIAFVFNAVGGSVDLAAIGATNTSGGAIGKAVRVGVKNVGSNPWFPAPPAIIAHIVLPANVRVRSVSQACHADGTREYTCRAEPLDPGATVWFDLKLDVDTDKPVATGHIVVVPGADNHPANDKAPIKVSSGASLPVTGPSTSFIGGISSALVIVGVFLLWITHRRRIKYPAVTDPHHAS